MNTTKSIFFDGENGRAASPATPACAEAGSSVRTGGSPPPTTPHTAHPMPPPGPPHSLIGPPPSPA
eukprot:259128-Prorocentrum_minimum.AAC.1